MNHNLNNLTNHPWSLIYVLNMVYTEFYSIRIPYTTNFLLSLKKHCSKCSLHSHYVHLYLSLSKIYSEILTLIVLEFGLNLT